MVVRVAINGFGRIGRPFFRLAFDNPELEIVAINGRTNPKSFAHLLKYDSTHGRYDKEVTWDEQNLIVEGKKIPVLAEPDPALLPWKDMNVDVVLESTGKFKDYDGAYKHITAGAKKVVISSPGKNEDITMVYGVNHTDYDPSKHTIISNASCTTTALAPVIKVILEQFGIKKGLMTTVHSYTNDQQILDKSHKDFRRARSAACSIIPTTTGAAKAVGLVLPEVKGKLNGFALRVPTPNVSLIDLALELAKPATAEEINQALAAAAEGELKGVLGYSDEPLVSIDYNGECLSGVVDGLSTMVVGDDLAKIVVWYDNEWGYSCRILDMILHVGKKL
ncbi:MAG: type I glyceraldehyde-3-phosphate dehydrogenase [Firmicutes bacterium]|nr:type I glyceraldehyde-3-phosphate dehydrogenase [Bacillota bacterium]